MPGREEAHCGWSYSTRVDLLQSYSLLPSIQASGWWHLPSASIQRSFDGSFIQMPLSCSYLLKQQPLARTRREGHPWPPSQPRDWYPHEIRNPQLCPCKPLSCQGSIQWILRLRSAPAFGFHFIGYPSAGWVFNPGSAASQHDPSSQNQKMKVDLVHASATLKLEWIPEVI